MQIHENFSLKKLNTFGMNVSARWYTEVSGTDELSTVFSDPQFATQQHLILGGGSNILFTKDFGGIVIHNRFGGITKVAEDENYVWLRAGAGEVWHHFVQHCISQNLGGVENLSLIPGSVGAGPMQNIGAYGVELKDVFHELEAYHIHEKTSRKFSADECRFGYRESIFKHEARNQYVITAVTFRLTKHHRLNTSYGAIEKELELMNISSPGVADVSEAVCRIRRSKLPDPAVTGNAGSFFKNPVIDSAKHTSLKAEFPDLVSYSQNDNTYKLAAGWLIEKCGWKGFREGDAGVHPMQALVLVNYGNAAGRDVYELSGKILNSVSSRFGVQLEREVNIA